MAENLFFSPCCSKNRFFCRLCARFRGRGGGGGGVGLNFKIPSARRRKKWHGGGRGGAWGLPGGKEEEEEEEDGSRSGRLRLHERRGLCVSPSPFPRRVPSLLLPREREAIGAHTVAMKRIRQKIFYFILLFACSILGKELYKNNFPRIAFHFGEFRIVFMPRDLELGGEGGEGGRMLCILSRWQTTTQTTTAKIVRGMERRKRRKRHATPSSSSSSFSL